MENPIHTVQSTRRFTLIQLQHFSDAYDRALQAKVHYKREHNDDAVLNVKIVICLMLAFYDYANVLGVAPLLRIVQEVCEESTDRNAKIAEIGDFYLLHFIRPRACPLVYPISYGILNENSLS